MDITFQFPKDENLLTVTDDATYITYTDEDFSAVSIVVSDLYYEVTQNVADDDAADLAERYPKDDIWIGCGLFDETWNQDAYVLNYLTSGVNDGITQYDTSIKKITLKGLTFYKFSYFQEEGNKQAPGGIIYLTLYRSKLYTVSFSNFYEYSIAAKYGTRFENTISINGIDTYLFMVFEDESETTSLSAQIIVMIAGGSVLAIAIVSVVLFHNKNKSQS